MKKLNKIKIIQIPMLNERCKIWNNVWKAARKSAGVCLIRDELSNQLNDYYDIIVIILIEWWMDKVEVEMAKFRAGDFKLSCYNVGFSLLIDLLAKKYENVI